MAGTISHAPGRVNAEMNLIPMIDVLLVMIVTFMLLLSVRHVLWVQTPPPMPAGPIVANPRQLVLELKTGSGYLLNGMPIADADLENVLSQVFRDRSTKLLFIKVAADRAYHDVIETMDRARGAGVQVLALVPPR